MANLDKKTALITGASRGLGAALAKRLAAEGAHVILTARTVGGLEEVDDAIRATGGEATLVPLDMKEFDKIDALGATIYERWGKLDILVGNAAMLGKLCPVTHTEPKIWQQIIDINLTANYRLLRATDPLLRVSDAGRAVFVTSGVTQMDAPYWGAYAASKAGLEQMVRSYATEVSTTNIRANIADPGVIATNMRAAAFPGEDTSLLPSPDDVAEAFLPLLMPNCPHHGERIALAA